ncbi:TPA: acyltransferase [Escherichia coli]|nr:phage DNA ejection protein [Escherichia coli]MCN2835188.1 DNA transfer protein [Escherichia coli]MCN8312831.1 DNA transfer protein [Escherichia coli]HAZ3892147.1 acyltransferase [Escherichia coli]HAZ3911734.1 acyltransferase [Escherichia coli]
MAYSIDSPLNLMSLVPDFRLEGLKEAQTFATTQQGIAQGIDNQRAIRQDARQQEFYKAMNETPPEQIASLRRKFPEFTQAIQQELGIQSAEHSAFVNSALNKISIAASTGNPNEIANALNSNSAALSSLGVSKDDAWQLYQQDPGRFNSLLNASRLATLPMDRQFDVQHKRDQLNEQIRQADMENARGWANIQNAQLDRAQRAQMHSDEMGLKLMELGQKGKPSADLIKGLNSDITNFGKNYNSVRAAANSLQALSKVNTGAAQLGIIFNYMKSLDPQSVVREGEQVQVMRSDGIWGQIKGYVDQLNAGNGLSQEARDNIVNAAKINANAMGQQFNQQVDEYLDTYGDTIPQGLKKSLGRRKAKLFDDVPAQPTPQGGNGQTKAAPSGISEGATATNPKTGQKLIYRNGQWQPM